MEQPTYGKASPKKGLWKIVLRTMKLTTFLLFAFALHLSATGLAQKVTLSGKNIPVARFLRIISQQTGYEFVYDPALLESLPAVTLDVKDAPLTTVLDACFKDRGFSYSLTNNTIVLQSPSPAPRPTAPPPSFDIRGRVTDAEGKPLAGATVLLKKLNRSVMSNTAGEFLLKEVPNGKYSVEISYIGYEKYVTEALVESHEVMIVAEMKQGANSLDEMQVIAYGTTTRRLNTGNVSTVKAADIEKQPVTNVLAAIEGRVPGMLTTQQTGVSGGEYKVQIRGQNSLANGSLPLYIIDGVPYSTYNVPNSTLSLGATIVGQGNPLSYINPSDIESVDVLKDADATAIYGSRGANGVILITTKKGRSGDMKFDLGSYEGFAKQAHPLKLLNREQYLQMRNEAFKNDGVTPDPTVDYDLLVWDTTRSTDWQKVLTGKTAHFTDARASISGGNDLTQYLISGDYHRETTVFPGSFSDQNGSAHVTITSASLNRKFKVQFSGLYQANSNNLVSSDMSSYIFTAPVAPPLYTAIGTLNWAPIIPGSVGTWANPLAGLLQTYKVKVNNLVSNAVFSYQLLPDLELKTSLGYTNMQTAEQTANPIAGNDPAYYTLYQVLGSASFANTTNSSWIIEPQITYQLDIGKGKLSVLVGSTIQNNIARGTKINASNYSTDALIGSPTGAATTATFSIADNQYKYNAVYGKLNYNWADKYLINLTARRDGSSRFGPGKQFADFGAVGAGWIFSKEAWTGKSLPFLSFGKLRGSYGTTGNDQIKDYQYLDQYGVTTYPYMGVLGLQPSALYNPNFAWEVTRKLEGGLELGVLKDRILLSGSYYTNRSSNQLTNYLLPSITGFSGRITNLPAVIRNTGWEFTLTSINIRTQNFTWSTNLNITTFRNRLASFPNFAQTPYASSSYALGKSLNIRKVYHSLGVDPQTGVYEFADKDGKPTFTPSPTTDRTTIMNLDPKFYGGIQNSFSYKGFLLDIFFEFRNQKQGNPMFFGYSAPGMFSGNSNYLSAVTDRWKKPGDKARFEKYTQSYSSDAYAAYEYAQASDLSFINASYVRLKNLSLSYTLPSYWMGAHAFKKAMVYIQGQNLLTFTGFKSDPETVSTAAISPLRVFTVGAQLNF